MNNEHGCDSRQISECSRMVESAKKYTGGSYSDFPLNADCDYVSRYQRRCVASLLGVVIETDDSPFDAFSPIVEYVDTCMAGVEYAVIEEAVKWVAENVSSEVADRMNDRLEKIFETDL